MVPLHRRWNEVGLYVLFIVGLAFVFYCQSRGIQ